MSSHNKDPLDLQVLSNARAQDDSQLRTAGERGQMLPVRGTALALLAVVLIVAGYNVWHRRDAVELYIASFFDPPFVRMIECPSLDQSARKAACGYLYSYLNPDDADEGLVRTPFIVFRSHAADRRDTPIIFVDGGPGGLTDANPEGGSLWSGFLNTDAAAWLSRHDLVVFSQRGLPDTIPSLDCGWGPYGAVDFDISYVSNYSIDELLDNNTYHTRNCAYELHSGGRALIHYSSSAAAHDLASLIVEAGLEGAYLWGASNGSFVTLTFLDDYEDLVSGVILEGVEPPGIADKPGNFDYFLDTLRRIAAECRLSPRCPGEKFNLFQRFHIKLTTLRSAPLRVEFESAVNGEMKQAVINDGLLIDLVWDALYTTDGIARVHALMSLDREAIKTQLRESEYPYISEEVYLAYRCNDADWRDWDATGVSDVPGISFEEWRMWTTHLVDKECAAWRGVSGASVNTSRIVASDVPVLMLNGELDVATPAPQMWQQLDYLPNGWAFEFKGLGHAVSDHPCAQAIIGKFLADPTRDPRDVCIDHLPDPEFR